MKKNNNLPDNLYYNQDYSWIKIDQDKAILGIIKPASDRVQEFVFANLPEKGKIIKKGEIYASLEAVKWSGHLSSPLSGEIIEVNEAVFDEPKIINQDPYGQGWIAKLKLTNLEEKKDLFSAETIKEWVEKELKK